MMVPALLMLFVGLLYFGFAILHFEFTQSKSQFNTDNLTEDEIYDWSKDPGFLEEQPKDLNKYRDHVRGVWLENPYFDINDTYEYERYTSE